MAPTGHTYHFTEAPEVYLVDDNVHVVDRIKGEVALHRIYPVTMLGALRERTRHLKSTAKLIAYLEDPAKVKKPKRKHKGKKRK